MHASTTIASRHRPVSGCMRDNGDNSTMAIRISHLTKKYGALTAVDNLCLTVPAGTLFGFLGPNGAGKSTTIGCLTGLLDPTAGEIRLLGEHFTAKASGLKRRIGVMPEGLALFDQLRASEFLALNGRLFGLDKATTWRRVEELLEVLELTSYPYMCLAEFSTGMRKKVAFAAAIIHSPEILFLDEPFAGMDATTVAMLKKWLRQFVARGRTVFMTTHVLESVERLCDRAAIITGGRLSWHGEIGGQIEFNRHGFDTLEALFLHIVGEPHDRLDWF